MRLRYPRRLMWQMTTPDDSQLLQAMCDGDRRALGLLLDRHGDGLELYCYLMLGDRVRARAALVETAQAAWDARGAAEPAPSARMWLYRVAIRVCSEADPRCAMSFGAEDSLTGERR